MQTLSMCGGTVALKSHQELLLGITIALLFISGVSRKPHRSRPNENGRPHWAESFSWKRFLDRSGQVESGVVGIRGR